MKIRVALACRGSLQVGSASDAGNTPRTQRNASPTITSGIIAFHTSQPSARPRKPKTAG